MLRENWRIVSTGGRRTASAVTAPLSFALGTAFALPALLAAAQPRVFLLIASWRRLR